MNEYEVQKNSGVMAVLDTYAYVEDYVDLDIKESLIYKIWWRPTLDFSLSCEESMGRQTVIQTLEKLENA